MIVLTGALAHLEDRVCLINPLYVAVVGALASAPWQDTPEAQQRHNDIQAAYPGARAEILLANGRSVFVHEAPSEVYAKFEEWVERASDGERRA